MKFGEVCAGISAASLAWAPLGWSAAWFAEVDPFASAVLKHHHADVPNHGNMVKLIDRLLTEPSDDTADIWGIDALMGGCPCQDFSISGLRASLSGDRGNLTLEFIRLADAVDDIRRAHGLAPIWIVYENVPGLHSVADNAFGSFMGGLVGSDAAVKPLPKRGWTGAGVVSGPRRSAAWRLSDAQYHGLAQRRNRIFVVAGGSAGTWGPPDALLPIIESMSWHSAPRRETGKEVAGSIAARTKGGGGAGQAFGGNNSGGGQLK